MHYTQVYNSHSVSPELAQWVHQMPKVEIHVHLEGAASADLIFEMAQRNAIALPASSVEEWRALYAFRDFNHFIEIYHLAVNCIQTAQDYRDLVEDFLRQQAAQNILYSEAYLSAALHYDKLPPDAILAALAEGAQAGKQKYGSRLAIIPDLTRQFVDQPHLHDYVLQFALGAKAMGIGFGMGLGGKEIGFPAELYRDLFAEARRAGLHVVAHGGETGGPQSVWGAIDALYAERLGHGIRSLDDPALVERLRESRIPIEVSPQSNYCTRVVPAGSAHPIRQMVDAGLFCTLNSDDPAMFSTDLDNEYLTLAAQGFTAPELWLLNLNTLAASFLSEEEKAEMGKTWEAYAAGGWPDPGDRIFLR